MIHDIEKHGVTIGITCFNAEKTICSAIQSAINQEWSNKEIIIVDDASSDGSWEIIKFLKRNNNFLKLIRKPKNSGVAEARNDIIKHSTKEFIAFFDDDDESEPSRVFTQLNNILKKEQELGTDLIACYASLLRNYQNRYKVDMYAIGSRGEIPRGMQIFDYLLLNVKKESVFYGNGIPASALMARRKVFSDLGGFDSRFRRLEDADWAIKLGMRGGYFVGTPDILLTQNVTAGADKNPKANFNGEMLLVEKYASYFNKRRDYIYAKQLIKIRFSYFDRRFLKLIKEIIILMSVSPFRGSKHVFRSSLIRYKLEDKIRKLTSL